MDEKKVLLETAVRFQFKKNKIEPPEIYLAVMFEKKNLNGLDMCKLMIRD